MLQVTGDRSRSSSCEKERPATQENTPAWGNDGANLGQAVSVTGAPEGDSHREGRVSEGSRRGDTEPEMGENEERKGTPLALSVECKPMQSLWRTARRFF